MKCRIITVILLGFSATVSRCYVQTGPDPWNYADLKVADKTDDSELTSELKFPAKEENQRKTKYGFGKRKWFKRLLTIMLKNSQLKKSEDGSIDISLQMRFDETKWGVLDECLKSDTELSDVMFRRVVGYLEDAIYIPTITDKIVLAWTNYIQTYFIECKIYVTRLVVILGALGVCVVLCKHVVPQHIIVIIFASFCIYEIISYEEPEHQRHKSAVNTCKWHFWTSECTQPSQDLILFMNSLAIAIKMFTSVIYELILTNSAVKEMLIEITDGLWYPFNMIIYGLFILCINILLMFLHILALFNVMFNIPLILNFLVKEIRHGSMFSKSTPTLKAQIKKNDRISVNR